jgi:hypothetical protein
MKKHSPANKQNTDATNKLNRKINATQLPLPIQSSFHKAAAAIQEETLQMEKQQ